MRDEIDRRSMAPCIDHLRKRRRKRRKEGGREEEAGERRGMKTREDKRTDRGKSIIWRGKKEGRGRRAEAREKDGGRRKEEKKRGKGKRTNLHTLIAEKRGMVMGTDTVKVKLWVYLWR